MKTLIKVSSSLFFFLASLLGKAQGQQTLQYMNNQELVRLQQESDARIRNQQKQLSPYDVNSRGGALNPMLPNCRDVSKLKTIDQGSIRISYALNAQNIAEPKTYDDLQRLEIGKNIVKYYGYYVYEADSIATVELKEMNRIMHSNMPFPDEGLSMSINGKHQGWSRYMCSEFFKDLTKNELKEYCRMPDALASHNCYYTEPIPKQDWQIKNETITIVGYQCQKATCNFRGRNYTAWFAVDIPLSYGPWKFCGLPGLILKVYDDKKGYVFECVGIEQPRQGFPIVLLNNYKTYRKTTRTELDKTLKRICENYYQITGMTNVVNKQLRPYNPMELK